MTAPSVANAPAQPNPGPRMQTSITRPPMNLPNAGVAAAPQPTTAVPPPLKAMRTSPSVALAYGAQGSDSRPY